LAPFVEAMGKRVLNLYTGPLGEGFQAHLELSDQPEDAETAIQGFIELLAHLTTDPKRWWDGATQRDFNIGIQGGAHPAEIELALRPETLAAVASLGARIVVTVYALDKAGCTEISARTPRLELVAATLEHVLAELSGSEELGSLLRTTVPASWPPGEYDGDALQYFKARLEEAEPSHAGWYNWYAIALGSAGRRESLVAGAGYLGPPVDGSVEVGYSVVPEARGRGYASEIVQFLVARAFSFAEVERVIAQTQEANLASSTVLARCGFVAVGPGAEAGSIRYERVRKAP
jgi:RimJ/RimL family protein N-acetyltransferase